MNQENSHNGAGDLSLPWARSLTKRRPPTRRMKCCRTLQLPSERIHHRRFPRVDETSKPADLALGVETVSGEALRRDTKPKSGRHCCQFPNLRVKTLSLRE